MAWTVCTFIQICANVDYRQYEIIILPDNAPNFLKKITTQSKMLLYKQYFFILQIALVSYLSLFILFERPCIFLN